jgi:hypothetical protein
LKATKAAIIRQAQLAKKDIASGRVSTHAKQAVDTLADYSNAAVELLELALDEAAKEQPDQALVDSFIFLFGQASEAGESGEKIMRRLDLQGSRRPMRRPCV